MAEDEVIRDLKKKLRSASRNGEFGLFTRVIWYVWCYLVLLPSPSWHSVFSFKRVLRFC